MAEFFIDVGKIKLTWQGNWSSSTDYVVDDLVWYDDGSTVSTYICVADNTNQGPSTTGTVNTSYWNLFAGGGLAGGLQPGGTTSNQIQYRSGLALGAETGFEYDPATDVLSVPAIAVTGSAAGSPAYDLDITGTIRATQVWEGANQLTYNISGTQVNSGTIDNARLPATVSVTDLAASAGLAVKTDGLMFDDSTDRVGIGTAVPGARLDVKSIATSVADDIVARFRSDHTNAFGTFIEVMPNTSQAQKSGIHLHKNSLRSQPFTIENDGGTVTFKNDEATTPSINVELNTQNYVAITPTLLTVETPLRVNGCFDEKVEALTINSGVVDIDAREASVFTLTLDDIVTSTTVTLPANSRSVSITMIITSNGSYSVAWPTNTKWPGGNTPTLSTTSGRVDVITLTTTNNGLSWLGFVGGLDFQ